MNRYRKNKKGIYDFSTSLDNNDVGLDTKKEKTGDITYNSDDQKLSMSERNLKVEDRVTTELYQNGKSVSEKDMPFKLKKTLESIKQKEIEKLKKEDDEKEKSSKDDANVYNDNNSITKNGVEDESYKKTRVNKRTKGSGVAAGTMPNISVDKKEAKPVKLSDNVEKHSKKKADAKNENPSNAEDVRDENSNDTSNNAQPNVNKPSGLDLSSREALRDSLNGKNKNKNAPLNAQLGMPKDNQKGFVSGNPEDEYDDYTSGKGTAQHENLNRANAKSNVKADINSDAGEPKQRVYNKPTPFTTMGSGATQGGGDENEDEDDFVGPPQPPRISRTGGAGGIMAGMGRAAMGMSKGFKVMAMGTFIGWGIIILIVVMLIIGAFSFLINMPGSVRDKIENATIEFWQSLKGVFVGQDLPSSEKIKSLAVYLEKMNCDLQYNGFVTKLEKDENGNIKELESKYLPAYLAAEQRGYMIANENKNMVSLWSNAKSLFGGDMSKFTDSWGTGMIVLDNELTTKVLTTTAKETIEETKNMATSLWNWITFSNEKNKEATRPKVELSNLSGLLQHVVINRSTEEMIISKPQLISLKNFRLGYDTYGYSLKEWTEKYGTPTELFITLQLATKAPEFVYKLATEYDTKVYVNIKELENTTLDVVYPQVDSKGLVQLDSKGKPIMKTVSEMGDEKIKQMGLSQEAINAMKNLEGRNIDAFTPYITNVINHWYYKQVIYQGEYKTTDGKEHQIDVYEARDLKDGDEGRVRYYLFTHASDKDKAQIEESTKQDVGGDFPFSLSGMGNLIRSLCGSVFSGDFSGLSGILGDATGLNKAFGEISSAITNAIPASVKNILSNDFTHALSDANFFKSGFDFSELGNLQVGDVAKWVNADGILNTININGLDINMGNMLKNLNLNDMGELASSAKDIDMSNLNNVFSDSMNDILDYGKTSIDTLTDELVNGFSNTLKDVENTIVGSCDELFSNLSEENLKQVTDGIIGGVSKNITELTSDQFLNYLQEPIKNAVSGKYNDQILNALENEASKQVLGVDYNTANQIAKMDINVLKETGSQLSNLESSVGNANINMTNLSNAVNKASKDLLGVDVGMLKSAATQVQNLSTNTVQAIENLNDFEKTMNTTMNLSDDNTKKIYNLVNEEKQLYTQLDEANKNLNTAQAKAIKDSIATKTQEIEQISKYSYGTDEFENKLLNSQINKLQTSNNAVFDLVDKMDVKTIESAKNQIGNMNYTSFIQLADDFYNMDPITSGLNQNMTLLGNGIQALTTDKLSNYLSNVTNYQSLMNTSINRVENYLLNATSQDLRNQYSSVMNTINLVQNASNGVNMNNVTQLINTVPGIKCNQITNLVSKIADFNGNGVDYLRNTAKNMAEEKLDSVIDGIETKIANGVKEKIASNLSDKLKNKMLSDSSFTKNLQKGMTTANKKDEYAVSGEENQSEVDPIVEYVSGFYIRETRTKDYFQVAEPIRVLYDAKTHWYPLFRENKYVIVNDPSVDLTKLADPAYINEHGKTLWDAMAGDISTPIYAMLQGICSSDSEYLLRYFKELFTDNAWVFENILSGEKTEKLDNIKSSTFGWIFESKEEIETINTQTNIQQTVYKTEYEPGTWVTNQVGILKPYSEDKVYGFKPGLSLVSPVDGVVVEKTEATKNELGQKVPESITIEVKGSGDENAEGMRVVLVGGTYQYVTVGTQVKKYTFSGSAERDDGKNTAQGSVIGETTNERIKIMVLDQDRTMVSEVSKYIKPPYEYNDQSVVKNAK